MSRWVGDVNIPSFLWKADKFFIPYNVLSNGAGLSDGMNLNGLFQISDVKTFRGRQFDLAFANDATVRNCTGILESPYALLTIDRYHPAMELSLSIPDSIPLMTPRA